MAAKVLLFTAPPPASQSSLRLSMIEHAPVPMAMVEGGGHIVCQVNAAFCRLLNRTREEFIGKPFYPLLQEQGAPGDLLDRVYRTGQPESHTAEQPFERPALFWTYTMWPVMEQDQPVGVMIQVTVATESLKHTIAMNEALVLGSVHQHELTAAGDKLNALLRARSNSDLRICLVSEQCPTEH